MINRFVEATYLAPSKKTAIFFLVPKLILAAKGITDLIQEKSAGDEITWMGLLTMARIGVFTFDRYFKIESKK